MLKSVDKNQQRVIVLPTLAGHRYTHGLPFLHVGIVVIEQNRENAGVSGLTTRTGRVGAFLRLLLRGGNAGEGLRLWRLCMVMCGFAPLFVLMAVKGNGMVPNLWWVGACGAMVLVPLLILLARMFLVFRNQTPHPIAIADIEDTRGHILVYLAATLLPFYRQDITSGRDLAAILGALVFIIFIFWHLNLHYVNVVLAVLRWRVFTVLPSQQGSPHDNPIPFIIITRRQWLVPGSTLRGYRLSDTPYWDAT